MTIALWCVLTAGLLPYAATVVAKAGAHFDNHLPRAWLATQSGYRARANAAQQNAFEAFPLFAVAVLVAMLRGVPEARLDTLALVFVAARIAYLAAYVADLAALRTLVWMVGIGSAVTIFVSAT